MQVKTFTGATSHEVLAQIKAELGPDAVILGNRTYRKNGMVHHEVTAGLERENTGPVPSRVDNPAGWNEWHKEWMQIKDQLFALMKPAIQLDRLTPRQRVALEYLQREGVSDSVTVDLYKKLLTDTKASVLECLCDMVSVKPWNDEQWNSRIHLISGPFGVGKTTAGLRIALAMRKINPDIRIAFVNTDCLRGNGRLTLRHWAELSNFMYIEAADKAVMQQALLASKDANFVFIDMPGLVQGQDLMNWRVNMGLADVDLATHLVLSPFCDSFQTQAFLQRYHCNGEGSLIWTKLDEAVSFGNIVNVSCMAKRPVSALSFGSELKESLVFATDPLVWRLIFKRQLPGGKA